MRRHGFTLVEILIAMVVLTVALFGLLTLNRSSNQGTMDAWFDFLALQLAREPLEVLGAFGCEWLTTPGNALASYPWDVWAPVTDAALHPPEAVQFDRRVEREPLAVAGVRGIRLKVTVRPRPGTAAKQWAARSEWVQQAVIPEEPR